MRVYSRLRQGLQSLARDNYDFVFIDCPPNFNIVTKTAIVASDYLLVPTKPDYLSTLGIEEIRAHLAGLVEEYNQHVASSEAPEWSAIQPQILGVLFTMIRLFKGDQPISTQQQYIEQVSRSELPVFNTRIRDNQSIYGDAPYGLPAVLKRVLNPTHRGAQSEFKNLTSEVLERIGA